MSILTNPDLLPLVGCVSSMLMTVTIVGTIFWFKARTKELQFHQDLRVREMEHQRKMKELEVELERIKARSISGHAA